jgi:uridine kinase
MQYNRFVKSSYKDFIYPTIRYADLIVPGSRNNRVSIDFIVRHMKNMTR